MGWATESARGADFDLGRGQKSQRFSDAAGGYPTDTDSPGLALATARIIPKVHLDSDSCNFMAIIRSVKKQLIFFWCFVKECTVYSGAGL